MNHFLRFQTKSAERVAYQNCPRRLRREVLDTLQAEREKIQASAAGSPNLLKPFHKKAKIFNTADAVFGFFLPCDFDGPTVGKFWGGLHSLLFVSLTCKPSRTLT